jgi:hypothetical protein
MSRSTAGGGQCLCASVKTERYIAFLKSPSAVPWSAVPRHLFHVLDFLALIVNLRIEETSTCQAPPPFPTSVTGKRRLGPRGIVATGRTDNLLHVFKSVVLLVVSESKELRCAKHARHSKLSAGGKTASTYARSCCHKPRSLRTTESQLAHRLRLPLRRSRLLTVFGASGSGTVRFKVRTNQGS